MNRALSAAACALLVASATARAAVTTVDRPDTATPNTHYPGNRAPLLPSPFIKLPLGAVRANGWLRKQLELQSAGFHGHLTEISAFLKKEGNAWLSPAGEGRNGWEEVPYWLKGFTDCAYLLDNADQIREARLWLEAALASQRDDGFFGPRPGGKSTVDSTAGKYDLWPNMVMLCCLQSYHDVTQDPRVINLMTRYFKWELTVPDADFLPPYWQKIRAGDNLWSVHWLYNRIGESWLIDLAAKIHAHTANFTDGIPDWHNVNLSQAFGGPTFFYPQSKDPKHLAASERNWQTIRDLYGQVPGGMFGGDENCRPGYADPRQAVESCGMVEMMFSHERLFAITGNPIWADRCEDVAFNSLPAALTADFKALRYLTAPNLISSDRHNKAPGYQNGGAMLHYNPHSHRCCQHNVGHGWPYFAEYLWMATPGNGLAATLYAASAVKATVGDGAQITLVESTHYPFDDTIELKLATARPVNFPLYLRIPGWCAKPTLALNGANITPAATRAGSYLRIDREWKNNDTLTLKLPMTLSLRTWARNNNSVSVDRGPLTYSLKIEENTVRQGGTDAWPAFEILPNSPWNFGLVLNPDYPALSFQVARDPWPESDQPFTPENSPIHLLAYAKRIPEWQADPLGLVGLLQPSPVVSTQFTETVTLIPMGAARLRIAAFPVIGDGTNAHRWKGPPPSAPYRATASHCNESDTVFALKDLGEPANSNDHGIPRFTWWDRKGSIEWVQYDFDAPRKVAAVDVYWFDDTPGGGCGLPQSWRVLYRAGTQWKEAAAAAASSVAKDHFNTLAFSPIETGALRLEVQLRPGLSGGILEWRVR
jgi:hypothetical protein